MELSSNRYHISYTSQKLMYQGIKGLFLPVAGSWDTCVNYPQFADVFLHLRADTLLPSFIAILAPIPFNFFEGNR